MNEIVYYIRRDGLIKIGYTGRFIERMRVLEPEELLAVEPGNLRLEAGRHQQFDAFHVQTPAGTEWFSPGPELMAHIETMASIYPKPELPAPRKKRVRIPRAKGQAKWGFDVPAKFFGVCAAKEGKLPMHRCVSACRG